MTQWYYSDNERNRHGPLDDAAMIGRHRDGELGPDTLVWRDGLSQWRPWREVAGELIAEPGFAPSGAASGASEIPAERTTAAIAMAIAQAEEREAPRSEHAQTIDTLDASDGAQAAASAPPTTSDATVRPAADDGLVAPMSATENRAATAPVSPSRASNPAIESASPYAAPRAEVADDGTVVQGLEVIPAGFWKRLAAYMIDSMLVTFVYYAIFAVLTIGAFMLFDPKNIAGLGPFSIWLTVASYGMYWLVSSLYYSGMESSAMQATLGKMALGIKVVDTEGKRLGRGRALARWASNLVSYATFFVGFLLIAFTDRKLGLHDMIAKTQVVDRWAYTARPELQRRELGPVGWIVLILGLLLWLLAVGAVLLMIGLAAKAGGH